MGNKDDLTIYNITDHLREKLELKFLWNLNSELLKRLESETKSTKDLLFVNDWFKTELETIVSPKNSPNFDYKRIKRAKSILNLIELKSSFDLDDERVLIYTAPYVRDGTYKLLKGSEVNNKSNLSLDVVMSFDYYKCNSGTPSLLEEAISSKIIRFSNLFAHFCKSKGINCDLKRLRNSSDSDATVYGRIGTEGEVPINPLNVTLQGSRTVDYGLKVQLQNLHSIDEFCLFPGQMVAVSGLFYEDNFGMKYLANDILSGVPVDKPFVTLTSQNRFMDENLHIMCVKGSLLTEKLEQTSFSEIYQVIKRDKPHVVIFTGPFISVNQVIAEGYQLSRLGDITFLYLKFLNDLANVSQIGLIKNTKFIIVPHPYDVILGYPLPQPPLNCKSTPIFNKAFPPNIIFLSNPAYFRLNGILFSITSCDPISSIYKNMVYKGIEDQLNRVCKELLLQRSFFPGYPAYRLQAEYPVDLKKLRELEFSKDLVPDVLLFCSAVKPEPFIEFTNQRAFVSLHNNSLGVKGKVIDTYTEIYITPLGNKEDDEPVQELDIQNRITLLYTTLK